MEIGSFSWRIIVGWFLVLFGGTSAVILVISGVVHVISLQLIPQRPLYKGAWWMIVGGMILQFSATSLWYLSGRRILAKQTWQPIVGCLVGYVCGVLGAMMLYPGGI